MSLPTLLDDLTFLLRCAVEHETGPEITGAYRRVATALRLLDQPGAKKWLEALPLFFFLHGDYPEFKPE